VTPPLLFDRSLARARLARAVAKGYPDFLLARAVEELTERLGAVLRRFPLVLDLGTPTEAAADRLRADERVGEVVRLAPSLPAGSLTAVGDEEALPFRPETFDLAVSLLALQSVNDLPGGLVQVRRALKPDGLFVGCFFGGATLTELRQSFAGAESEREGGASPRVAPFVEVRALGNLLQRAGFTLPVADVETVTVRYRDPFALMRDLRGMGLANALRERRRGPLRRSTLLRAAELYTERFADADGRVRATFEFLWFSGWSPHASQQKPLRPGSAKVRLADALGATETRLSHDA
jgi:SAM-dependent methyltransferase